MCRRGSRSALKKTRMMWAVNGGDLIEFRKMKKNSACGEE
jgi:hypothetical protein